MSDENGRRYLPCLHCGKPFVYILNEPKPGDIVYSKDVLFPDGTHPRDGDPMICRHCGWYCPVFALATHRIQVEKGGDK